MRDLMVVRRSDDISQILTVVEEKNVERAEAWNFISDAMKHVSQAGRCLGWNVGT